MYKTNKKNTKIKTNKQTNKYITKKLVSSVNIGYCVFIQSVLTVSLLLYTFSKL